MVWKMDDGGAVICPMYFNKSQIPRWMKELIFPWYKRSIIQSIRTEEERQIWREEEICQHNILRHLKQRSNDSAELEKRKKNE